jgi:signal transduction histidine kinase
VWTSLYLTFLFSVAAIALGLAAFAWWRGQTPDSKAFAALSALIGLETLTRALFMLSGSEEEARLIDHASYIFEALIAPAYLIFVLRFTGRARLLAGWRLPALLAVPMATGLVTLTDGWHHLLVQAFGVAALGPFTVISIWQPGPWYWVHVAASYALAMAAIVLSQRQVARARGLARQQAILLLVASLLIVSTSLFDLFDSAETWLTALPFGYLLYVILVGLALFRYRLLDIMPVAHRAIIEHMADAVIVLDSAGRIVEMNPAASALLGESGQPVAVGQLAAEALPGLPSGNETHADLRWRRRDGWHHLDINLSALRVRGGTVGTVMALRDVTEREHMITELDAFAHTVAHDLKGPLAAMTGFAHLLASDLSATPGVGAPTQEMAQTMIESAGQMTGIVDALLLLASVRRMDEVASGPLAMGPLLAAALGRVEPLRQQMGGSISLPDRWPEAVGYAPWLGEVWVNYLSNALKYGGKPQVEVGADPPQASSVRFWVRDHGPGLTAIQQAKLFAPFERLEQVHTQGYGLGLSIVRRIVERLGGEVGVDSAPGQGSTFWFSLPTSPPR